MFNKNRLSPIWRIPIQIQHLLMFNKITAPASQTERLIQIQHLLMFNRESLGNVFLGILIQIQHLLMFNGGSEPGKSYAGYHSNTTLVNVQQR